MRMQVVAYLMLHVVNWHTLWVNNETFAGGHTHCQVGDLISVPIAKASIKGIPFSGKQSSDVLQTPDFEFVRTPQDLQSHGPCYAAIWMPCVRPAYEDSLIMTCCKCVAQKPC